MNIERATRKVERNKRANGGWFIMRLDSIKLRIVLPADLIVKMAFFFLLSECGDLVPLWIARRFRPRNHQPKAAQSPTRNVISTPYVTMFTKPNSIQSGTRFPHSIAPH